MATKTKPSPRMTLGQLKVPVLTYHASEEIPAHRGGERFALANWERAWREVRQGRVVSFLCDPSEVNDARSCAVEQLGRDTMEDESIHAVCLRYDAKEGRLWAWLATYSPFPGRCNDIVG